MKLSYLHEPSPGIFYLDHRLTPEVRAMLASMASRLPSGGIKARYTQVLESILSAGALHPVDNLAHAEELLTSYPLHPRVQGFFDEFVGRYGHSSIQEQTGEPAVYLEGCSWFTNWLLFDSPLVSGQEFSTRAVRRADWPMARESRIVEGIAWDEAVSESTVTDPSLVSLHQEWLKVFEAEIAWWTGEFKSPCPSCHDLPISVAEAFKSHPHVTNVTWDGEVKVDGSVTGDSVLFEPLWDDLVSTPHASYDRCKTCGGTGKKYPTADKEPFRPALDRARWALPGTISTGACFTSNVRERARVIRDSSLVGGEQSVWEDLTEVYKKALPGISVHAFRSPPPDHQIPGHLQSILRPAKRLTSPSGVEVRIFNNKGNCRGSTPYTRARPRTYSDPWRNRDTRVEVTIDCSIATARDWHRHRTMYPWHMALVKDAGDRLVLSPDYEIKSDYALSKYESLVNRSSHLHAEFMAAGDVQRAALALPLGTLVQISGSGGYRDVLYTMELRAHAHGANFEYKRQAESCLSLMDG